MPLVPSSNLPTAEKPTEPDHPFCFACGYDLSGLSLPHSCPECGRFRQPDVDESAARHWFTTRAAAWQFFVRPGKVPVGLLYVLSDDASARIARRRLWRWLYLPAMLAFGSVAAGWFVTVDCVTTTRFYKRGDPSRKVLRVHTAEETDRVFDFNLHLFRYGLFYQPSESWARDVDRKPRSIGVSIPDYFNPLPFYTGCLPAFLVLFAHIATRKAATIYARSERGSRCAGLQRSIRAVWSLFAVSLGLGCWIWLLDAWLLAATQLTVLPEAAEVVIIGIGYVVSIGWVLATFAGILRIVAADRARCAFHHPRLLVIILFLLGIATPICSLWFIHRLIW